MKSSTKDKAEGKMHQVKGKVKETVGKAVGNKDLEAEGKGDNLKGKLRRRLGTSRKFWVNREVLFSRSHAQRGNEG